MDEARPSGVDQSCVSAGSLSEQRRVTMGRPRGACSSGVLRSWLEAMCRAAIRVIGSTAPSQLVQGAATIARQRPRHQVKHAGMMYVPGQSACHAD